MDVAELVKHAEFVHKTVNLEAGRPVVEVLRIILIEIQYHTKISMD